MTPTSRPTPAIRVTAIPAVTRGGRKQGSSRIKASNRKTAPARYPEPGLPAYSENPRSTVLPTAPCALSFGNSRFPFYRLIHTIAFPPCGFFLSFHSGSVLCRESNADLQRTVFIFRRDRAAHPFGQVPCDGQAEAGRAAGGLHGVEAGEQTCGLHAAERRRAV